MPTFKLLDTQDFNLDVSSKKFTLVVTNVGTQTLLEDLAHLSDLEAFTRLVPVDGIGEPEAGAVPVILGPHPTLAGAYIFDWSSIVVSMITWIDSNTWDDSDTWTE